MFLDKIGKEHPELKTTYQTFKRNENMYLSGRLKALIRDYGKNMKSLAIDKEMFECFKEHYLGPKRFSMMKCMQLIAVDERFKAALIPSGTTFKRIMYKEYDQKTIEEIRKTSHSLPTLPGPKIQIDKKNTAFHYRSVTFEKYIDAVDYYLKSQEYGKQDDHVKASQKVYFYNHLNQFFEGLIFNEIAQEKVNEFENIKFKQWHALSSTSRIFALLSKIIYLYSNVPKQFVLYGLNKLGTCPSKTSLTNVQIKKLLQLDTKIKLALMFILSLGLNQSELLGLEYEDIDFKKRTISITKILYKGKLQKYRCHYQLRTLNIPGVLFSKIPTSQRGRIFDISVDELDNVIAKLAKPLKLKTLTYDELENNTEIHLISKNMAFADVRDFLRKYEKFISH